MWWVATNLICCPNLCDDVLRQDAALCVSMVSGVTAGVCRMFSMYTCLFLCAYIASLFPSITHVQLASKFPSSSIMDQGMFSLLVPKHLSKRASNSPACPGTCPSERNGDPNDMDGELRQHRAPQILISGVVFELDSLSQSPTGLCGGLKRPHNKERKNLQACMIPATFDW